MYDIDVLQTSCNRLKEHYPEYDISLLNGVLTVKGLYGKGEVNRKGGKLYVNGMLYDEFSSEETKDIDGLYERLELFFIDLQNFGMEKGNEIYIAAKAKVSQWTTRLLVLICLIGIGFLVAFLVTKNLWWGLLFFMCPAAALILLKHLKRKIFNKYWVCPQCKECLPLNKKSRFHQMQYVNRCPHCGLVLEKVPNIKPICQNIKNFEKASVYSGDLPAQSKKWPCFLIGGSTIIWTLLLFSMLFALDEPVEPIGMILYIVLEGILFGFGLLLLLCQHTEPETYSKCAVVVREGKAVGIIGIIVWFIGFTIMFFAIGAAIMKPFDAAFVLLTALSGVGLTLLGVWMILARRNRTLFIFDDDSIQYISSWGRARNFEPRQLAAVRTTTNESIWLLDQNGKKLAALENNMQGAERFREWVEHTGLTVKEKQESRQRTKQSVVQWREEYRTPLHSHLPMIRIGFFGVVFLLVAGSVLPYTLYLFADLKIATAIYLTAFSPIPLLLYYIIFAPVFWVDDWPSGATNEWKAMHIKFPVMPITLIELFIFAQIGYFWERNVLRIADFGRFFILYAMLTGLLVALFWMRTPKRIRVEEGFGLIILSLIMLGFVLTFGASLAISKPAEHYPAVVVERCDPSEENEKKDRTLTIKLDDGSTIKFNVSKRVYDLEKAGVPFVICQKENFLGIRMVRLHLPKGTDVSALPDISG